jgi:hypothetical protein
VSIPTPFAVGRFAEASTNGMPALPMTAAMATSLAIRDGVAVAVP